MGTAKEKLAELLDNQPDDSSYEEIVRELVFRVMIERGLKDSDKGLVIYDDELAQRIKQW